MIQFVQPLTQRYYAGRKEVSEMTTLRVGEATTLLSRLRHDLQGLPAWLPRTP